MHKSTLLIRLLTLGLLLFAPLVVEGRERISGWCEQGGEQVTVGGLTSTENVQRSYPSCTITIFDSGTMDLTSIFSDDSGTVKANPFTASSTGFWFFYSNDGRVDVRLSGGGIVTPFTIGDILLDDTKNDVTTIVSVASSATPTFDASLGTIFTNTLTANVTSSTISNPVTGQRITLYLVQDGVGGFTFAFPANVQLRKGGYVISDDASAVSVIKLYYDGTNWRETARDADEVGHTITPVGATLTVAGNIVPDVTGENLGAAGTRYDGFFDVVTAGLWNNIPVVDGNKHTTLSSAIAALGANGGIVLVAEGNENFASTLTITGNNVWIICRGQGGTTGSALKAGATSFTWTGSAGGTMIRWGNQADHILGGGMIGCELNGGALAAKLLHITDAQHFDFANLYLRNPRTNANDEGITLDNNLASANPTGKGNFRNVSVDVGASSGSANCIGIRGTLATGVFGITWDNLRCLHRDGTGVLITLGDGMVWNNPQIFRGSGGTGQGFDIRPANASDPVSGHVLIDPVITGGVRIETSGAAALDSTQQLTILHYGTVDSGSITGAGAGVNVVALLDDGTWEGRSQDFTGGLEVSGSNTFVRSGSGTSDFTSSGFVNFTGADVRVQNGLAVIGYSDGASTETFRMNTGTGEADFNRFKSSGTALVAGDIAISTTGAWGDTADAAVGSVSGNDQWFQWTITAGGANTGANPTIIITFTDGTWTNTPIVLCNRQDFNAPATVTVTVTTVTATVLTLTFDGTPTATNLYKFACHVGGV